MDPIEAFKAAQRKRWAHFAPFESHTTPSAARLVMHARIRAGQRVLDVACGTGVVSVTAARVGAHVTGLDLTPQLLQRARENAAVGGVSIDFHEGDVEALPFADASFDVVTSQYGHMFAPRPAVAIAEMLRVLKPGGTIAFSTWPPEVFVGRMFSLVASYLPPPTAGVAAPPSWGDVGVVLERLGDAVRDVRFDRAVAFIPALSPQHYRDNAERTSGPLIALVESLSAGAPDRLAEFRRAYDELTSEYFENNVIRQDYLMTGAIKA